MNFKVEFCHFVCITIFQIKNFQTNMCMMFCVIVLKSAGDFMFEKSIYIDREDYIISLFGDFDKNIKIVEQEYNVSIVYRGSEIKLVGDSEDVLKASDVTNALLSCIENGEKITEHTIRYCIYLINSGFKDKLENLFSGCICLNSKGKAIKPKTIGQKKYCEAIKNNTITFGIGPAGTGKTYLAVACAVSAFREHEVNRIILTRPAVEAGESLGFLPGDLQQKVDPYLRPLYDALFDLFGAETYQRYVEKGNIEIAPLAYMRGRTLDDSFVILDEAQNTTCEQMKMFLTRLGFGSKMVITGDITQIDLPNKRKSGLKEAINILNGIDNIIKINFTEKDVVRHKLVQDIIRAYDYNNKEDI